MNVYVQWKVFVSALAVSFFILPATANAAGFCVDANGEAGREAVCKIVNKERAERGRKPLELDEDLSEVAQSHAEDMLSRKYFSHTGRDGSSVSSRLRRGKVEFTRSGENIAWGQKTEALVMRAWMNSRGHRTNILHSQYGRIGIGRAGNIWVQVFTN